MAMEEGYYWSCNSSRTFGVGKSTDDHLQVLAITFSTKTAENGTKTAENGTKTAQNGTKTAQNGTKTAQNDRRSSAQVFLSETLPGYNFISGQFLSGIVDPHGKESKTMGANADLFEIAKAIRSSESLSYDVIVTPSKVRLYT